MTFKTFLKIILLLFYAATPHKISIREYFTFRYFSYYRPAGEPIPAGKPAYFTSWGRLRVETGGVALFPGVRTERRMIRGYT